MMAAPMGMRHGKAKVSFETIQKCRTLRKEKGWSVSRIAEHAQVPWNTVNDWIYYRTRALK